MLSAFTFLNRAGAAPTGDERSAAPDVIVWITPVADTWVQMPMDVPSGIGTVEPDATPRGSEGTLRGGWNHLSPDERSLLRFAIPTTEPGLALEQATLELEMLYAGISYY